MIFFFRRHLCPLQTVLSPVFPVAFATSALGSLSPRCFSFFSKEFNKCVAVITSAKHTKKKENVFLNDPSPGHPFALAIKKSNAIFK